MSGEFSKLSDLELVSLIHRTQQEIEQRKESGKERLRAEIEEKLKMFGFELNDIFPETAKKARKASSRSADEEHKPARAKFKNHASGETWSGRGPRPPQWVKDIMRARGWESLEQFKACEEFHSQD